METKLILLFLFFASLSGCIDPDSRPDSTNHTGELNGTTTPPPDPGPETDIQERFYIESPIAFTFFADTDLEGENAQLETFVPQDHCDRAGRPAWVHIWNRTGQVLLEEHLGKCEAWVTLNVTFPPNPPYLIRYYSAAGDIRGDLPAADFRTKNLCRNTHADCNQDHALYNWDSVFLQGHIPTHLFNVTVPPGAIEGCTKLRLSEAVTDHLSNGRDEVLEGSRSGNMTWNRPNGITEYYQDYRLIGDNEVGIRGVVSESGTWDICVELDALHPNETKWQIHWQGLYFLPGVNQIGFDWPESYFNYIEVVGTTSEGLGLSK